MMSSRAIGPSSRRNQITIGESASATPSECWRPKVRGETPTATKETSVITAIEISSARQKPSTTLVTASVMQTAATLSATVRKKAVTERYAAHNYHPLPVVLSHGEGAWVTDVDGRRYLDCLAG